MSGLLDRAGLRLLFQFDPETAHGFSLKALKTGLARNRAVPADPRLGVRVAGLDFPNPLGLAAGYDKNAEVAAALFSLGFGFVEVGSVTPRPQSGNPRPRIFRLTEDRAVINRLGFNNAGHATALANLRAKPPAGIVGINIGANKDSEDRVADYVEGVRAFHDVVSYFTVNVSSPNTPGLRDMQGRAALEALLAAVLTERDAIAADSGRRLPVFVKIAPDLTEQGIDDIVAATRATTPDGLILTNTTIQRGGLTDANHAAESGGMSGRPLFRRATAVLARFRQRLGPDMPLIGAGGVESADTAAEKIRAGADLVQFYSGMIYGGPGLPVEILKGLSALCDREGLNKLSDIRDSEVDRWAKEPF